MIQSKHATVASYAPRAIHASEMLMFR